MSILRSRGRFAWIAAALAASCASPDNEHRLARIDARLAEMEARIARLEQGSRRGPSRAEIGERASIERRLDELDERLDAVGAAGAEPAESAAGRYPGKRGGPDPKAVYAVDIRGDAWEGTRDAAVTVVEAIDFAGPYCHKVRPTLEQLLKDYKGDIKIVYKHYLVFPRISTDAARAACAASRQGKFVEMHDSIWKEAYLPYRSSRDETHFSAGAMRALAQRIGLRMRRYDHDVAGSCNADVATDMAAFQKVGVSGVPAFFINGRHLRGAQPLAQFKALIDEELKLARERIARGEATAANYYQKFVVSRGKARAP